MKIRIISVRRFHQNKKNCIKTKEFGNKFSRSEDISHSLEVSKAMKPGREQKRINVDFPAYMIQSLDKKAKQMEITRQSIIKVWIAERFQRIS